MTNDPTLLKLSVPFYLVYCNSSVNNSTAPAIDRFRYYLCASLARHHSYKVAYWNETAATSVGGSATTVAHVELKYLMDMLEGTLQHWSLRARAQQDY